ncbi:YkvA family protein [Halomonas sp. SSL-5]|uniref:YkvA family protein n=1 Tax=Halomonas sp. SSL-5 TaxID=3065855 RepID=UPI002738B6AC|nr:YkvA family protein [Halomonas sp. SSL-5]MDY7115689.1 YkvA family protein [Halomonas sp. SSL-5]
MAGKGGNLKTRLRGRSRLIGRITRALRLFVPMLGDVLRGRYRPVPWAAILWMLAALAYLVSPLDLIPDVLVLVGVLDDAVIVGWLLTRVDAALAPYRAWREGGVDSGEDGTAGA